MMEEGSAWKSGIFACDETDPLRAESLGRVSLRKGGTPSGRDCKRAKKICEFFVCCESFSRENDE